MKGALQNNIPKSNDGLENVKLLYGSAVLEKMGQDLHIMEWCIRYVRRFQFGVALVTLSFLF